MADTIDVTTTSTTINVAGVDREFGFLNTYDKGEFVREWRKQRKAKLLENLKTANADPETVAQSLEAFDDDPPDFVEWLKHDDGKFFVCRLSLRKKYPNDVETILQNLDLSGDEFYELTLSLFRKFVKVETPAPPLRSAPPPRVSASFGKLRFKSM